MGYNQKHHGKYRARLSDPLGKFHSKSFTRKADAERLLREVEVFVAAAAAAGFARSVDREHTFEAAGGVPQLCRTDRMGALGQSQARRFKSHAPTLEFARHHGTDSRARGSSPAVAVAVAVARILGSA